jgi:Protein of unknown function, DUF547
MDQGEKGGTVFHVGCVGAEMTKWVHSSYVRGVISLVFVAAAGLAGGCAGGAADVTPQAPAQLPEEFSNADWATVLRAVATPDGYVKWDLVQSDDHGVRTALMRYMGLVQAVSPESRPALFPSDGDKRAYWINAFNATCMYAAIEHGYPDTMLAGTPPGAIFEVEQFAFGGKRMTLNQLVRNELKPADDARVLFAINYSAMSSAPLRSSPYDGAVLGAQLLDQGQRYLSDPRAAVRNGNAVELNDLFFRYRQDFLSAFQKLMGRPAKGILDALQPYVQNDSAIVGSTRVERLGFDWSLNRPPKY